MLARNLVNPYVDPVPIDDRVSAARELARERVPATLRALKAYNRLRDEDIAAACGMVRTAVHNRMHGKTQCSSEDLAAFAAFFQVPVSRFFTGELEKSDDAGRRSAMRSSPWRSVIDREPSGQSPSAGSDSSPRRSGCIYEPTNRLVGRAPLPMAA
jgi:transcriptional regulator with XRE-family HTH domain